MEVIRKRLKGLASLFTAAAISLTAVPMTALAADVTNNSGSDLTSAKVLVTTQDLKNVKTLYSDSDTDGLVFTAAKSASNPTAGGVNKSLPFNAQEYLEEYVPGFYELGDTWSAWGGANVQITSNGCKIDTQLVQADTKIGTYSFADTSELTASMAQEAIDAAKQAYANCSDQFVLLKPEIKPIDYTVILVMC